jgi:hypothetical protein
VLVVDDGSTNDLADALRPFDAQVSIRWKRLSQLSRHLREPH